ncbi:hypothetical protein [Streptomyces sp. Qhu_M48]|uniref:hypothetical protein n=1 Tax=Streptomyces sp. Qhu_M48 TaxID=3435889 RepID=UPI003F50803D
MITLTFPARLDPSEPQRSNYATTEAYEHAWYTWRAQRRDGRLNSEEMAAQFEVIEAHVRYICRRDP